MKTNSQVPEKRNTTIGSIDVHSVFSTIQGEGPFTGHPAIFVRLAGCNLQCPGCDTEYTQGRTRYIPADLFRLVESVKLMDNSAAKLVVITGGEPFRQYISHFAKMLLGHGYEVQIETNGTMPIPNDFPSSAVIVCSPKAAKIHPSVALRADCFKYVMKFGNTLEADGLPLQALGHRATPHIARPPVHFKGTIYLQPMDEKDEEANFLNTQAVVVSCKEHGYVLQLQIHKFILVE